MYTRWQWSYETIFLAFFSFEIENYITICFVYSFVYLFTYWYMCVQMHTLWNIGEGSTFGPGHQATIFVFFWFTQLTCLDISLGVIHSSFYLLNKTWLLSVELQAVICTPSADNYKSLIWHVVFFRLWFYGRNCVFDTLSVLALLLLQISMPSSSSSCDVFTDCATVCFWRTV